MYHEQKEQSVIIEQKKYTFLRMEFHCDSFLTEQLSINNTND